MPDVAQVRDPKKEVLQSNPTDALKIVERAQKAYAERHGDLDEKISRELQKTDKQKGEEFLRDPAARMGNIEALLNGVTERAQTPSEGRSINGALSQSRQLADVAKLLFGEAVDMLVTDTAAAGQRVQLGKRVLAASLDALDERRKPAAQEPSEETEVPGVDERDKKILTAVGIVEQLTGELTHVDRSGVGKALAKDLRALVPNKAAQR